MPVPTRKMDSSSGRNDKGKVNGKRRNFVNAGRSSHSGTSERTQGIDGIYHNAAFMHAITSQVGNVVKVYTHTGGVYEGIFKTFSSAFEVVLQLAHKIDESFPSSVNVNLVADKLIFKAQDIILIEVIDAELDYATKDTFQTDTAISKFNGQVSEKELVPWNCPGNSGEECELDDNGSVNGWDVDDMFRQNEEVYGVTSSFDQVMTEYTTQLQNVDTKDYKEAEARASKIANEIENNPVYKTRVELENGDEEEKFAAVSREDMKDSTDLPNKYTSNNVRRTSPKPPRNSHYNLSQTSETKVSSNAYYHHGAPSNSNLANQEQICALDPKPQRALMNRHTRIYSSDVLRTISNANSNEKGLVHQPSVSNSSSVISSDIVHKKPIPHLQSASENASINIPQKKLIRSREEHFNEFRKFSTDFKLSETKEGTLDDIEDKLAEEHKMDNQKRSDVTEENSVPVRSLVESNPEKERKTAYSTSKLNPNAKEFVYNPGSRPFTPRSPGMGNAPRIQTPQAPYGVQSAPLPMMMPTYVVTTAQPPYSQPPNQPGRYRKVPIGMAPRPDISSQMQVAAATGQPLLAPGPLPAQFTVPYAPPTHIAPQPYQPMVRMVPQPAGGMMPLVPAPIGYPPDPQPQPIQYMGPPGMANNSYAPLHHNPNIHPHGLPPAVHIHHHHATHQHPMPPSNPVGQPAHHIQLILPHGHK